MSLESKVSRRELLKSGAKLGGGLLLAGNLSLLKGCAPNVFDGVVGQPHTIEDIINNPDVVRYMGSLVSEGINFPITRGDNPPNIVGEYEVEGIPLKYVSVGTPAGILGSGTFNFLNQTPTNDIALDFSQQLAPFTQSAKSVFGKISGEGNFFTVYSALDFLSKLSLSGEFSYLGKECKMKTNLIISGEKKENGDLEGFYVGVPIEKPKVPECTYDSLYGICSFRRESTDDGLVELVKGLDVSHHQNDKGPIDWSKVYNAGYRFVFVKATDDDGNDDWARKFNDGYFKINMDNATSVGLLAGPYHFATPSTSVNATNSARFFINKAQNYIQDGYLRPVLDIERTEGLDKEKLTSWVHEWMGVVKKETGIEPIIYTFSDFARNNLDSSINQYNLWIAHHTYDLSRDPDTVWWNGNWDFWQFSDKGKISGVIGNVDEDVFNGTMDRLRTFLTTK